MSEFVVYTDGASRKDGRGGWGYCIYWDGQWWDQCGGAYDTTNNRMELQAVISALAMVHSYAEPGETLEIQLWADSQYVLRGITEYIEDWKFRGWRTSGNKPVKNVDLWLDLEKLSEIHTIDWQWVKGHTGNEGNERADALASAGIPALREEKALPQTGSLQVRRRSPRRGDTDGKAIVGWGS